MSGYLYLKRRGHRTAVLSFTPTVVEVIMFGGDSVGSYHTIISSTMIIELSEFVFVCLCVFVYGVLARIFLIPVVEGKIRVHCCIHVMGLCVDGNMWQCMR